MDTSAVLRLIGEAAAANSDVLLFADETDIHHGLFLGIDDDSTRGRFECPITADQNSQPTLRPLAS